MKLTKKGKSEIFKNAWKEAKEEASYLFCDQTAKELFPKYLKEAYEEAKMWKVEHNLRFNWLNGSISFYKLITNETYILDSSKMRKSHHSKWFTQICREKFHNFSSEEVSRIQKAVNIKY